MSNDGEHASKTVPTVDELPKSSRKHGLLTCISGANVPPIEVVDSVILGTSTPLPALADVAINHTRVWRSAAGAFLLEDLGTATGTFVNDVRVERRTLILGDRIRLGSSLVFQFTF